LSDTSLRYALQLQGPQSARQYAWHDVSQRVLDVYERAHHTARAIVPLSGVVRPRLPAPPLLATSSSALLVASIRRPPPFVDTTQGVPPMLTEPFEARVRAVTQRFVGFVLGRTKITPNVLTILGLVLTAGVTVTLATGHLVWGGILVLLTSAFDMFDGALARATQRNSTFGAFFDSTIDRYAEALIFFGLLLYYQRVPSSQLEMSLVYLSIIGSLMVSYTRARAEALGVECKVGILARPERVILLSIGLITGWLSFTLAILALFTNITAVQRIYHVWATSTRDARSAEVVKPQRRGWFASRDQSPS
jgi:CDP-diacylglycerol---glycerol-3-phosphate 3-phosphatidyltransferase